MTDAFTAQATCGTAIALAGGGVCFALTDAVAISVVTSSAAVIMAGISAYFAYKAKATSEETHKAANSRLSEFMELAKKSYTAEGVLKGEQDEKAKQAIKAEGALSSLTPKPTTDKPSL